jgi:peptidoglycan/xylan/chitin deacetylase (PgdA/CDA1 family)
VTPAHRRLRATRRFVRAGVRGVASRVAGSIVGSVVAVRTTAPDIVLTYDDGPSPSGTPAVLDALADFGATATFFVLLTRTRRYPELLREVVAAGHEIGLHGVDHRRLANISPAEVRKRTRDGRRELEDQVGRQIRWFRPPYGEQTPRRWWSVTRAGLMPVAWHGDLADWLHVSDEDRMTAALRRAKPGGIILGHDGLAGPLDGVDDGPLPVLDRGALARRVLAAYRERGLAACSLGEALQRGTALRRPWFD